MSDIALVERGTVGTPPHGGSEAACTGRRASTGIDSRGRFRGLGSDLDAVALDAPSGADVDRWQRSLRASDGVRWGLIDQVRHSIERGNYFTDDRLDVATRELARDLGH